MPDRQSSPGEVTERPERDARQNGNGHHPVEAPETGTPEAPTVAEQVAEQVAAEPAAVEPGPTEPGDATPAPDTQVVDGSALTEVADGASDAATPASARRGVEASATTPESVSTPEAASADGRPADDAPAPDGPDATAPVTTAPVTTTLATSQSGAAAAAEDPSGAAGPPAAQPARAQPAQAQPARPAEAGPAVAGRATPSPQPRPRPAAAAGDGPTVPTATPSPAVVEPTAGGPGVAAAPGVSGAASDTGTAASERPAAAAGARPDGEAPTVAVPAAVSPGPGDTDPAAPDAPTVAAPLPTSDATRSWFEARDTEATQMIHRSEAGTATAAAAPPVFDPPTERFAAVTPAAAPPPTGGPGAPGAADGGPRRPRRRLLLVAGVLALLALLYVGDLLLSSGSVPRGVAVAGVQVGGLPTGEAEQRLRAAIEPRATRPVAVTVGEARAEIDPTTAGLTVDWTGTLEQAGSQPLNPITRITSFFTEREVGVVTTADRAALDAAVAELAPIVDRAPVEGTVEFEGATPVPVDPVPGQSLDLPGAAEVLTREWATGSTVVLPLTALPPATTPDDVAAAVADIAEPAVSAPVTVTGEGGTRATLSPEDIAEVLTFRAEPDGTLVPELNLEAVTEALKPQLAASEQPSRDAELDFSSGSPVVVPSQDGRGIDYEATLADLLTVLTGTGPREITAIYADQPAELTTEELDSLGISGVIGEFTTRGFASDSGLNIKRAAEVINGTIVQPGETFSLNAATAPRNAANGYVEAGIISDGHPSRGIGGGVSQVATTVYNASYFAGMVDVAHKEHSFYISRYPAGREATVFEGAIDLKFRNDNPTAVMIETVWTPESLTVRLYGTKRYEVTSTPGPRTNPTSPNTVTIPAGEPCSPSQGAPGFTITDTRTLREISTGQVRNETRTVRYNPSPIVVCEE